MMQRNPSRTTRAIFARHRDGGLFRNPAVASGLLACLIICAFSIGSLPRTGSAQPVIVQSPQEKRSSNTAAVTVFSPLGARVSVDGHTVASGQTVSIGELASGKYRKVEVEVVTKDGTSHAETVLLLPGIQVRLPLGWSTAENPRLALQIGHRDEIRAITHSLDGRYVLTGSRDRSAILWDAKSGRKLRHFTGFVHEIVSVAISPDSRHAILGFAGSDEEDDRGIRLIDLLTGQRVPTPRFDNRAGAVAFDAVGKRFVVGSLVYHVGGTDKGVKLLTDEVTLWGNPHWPTIEEALCLGRQIAFVDDGRRILTNTLSLIVEWDAGSGKLLRHFGHPETIDYARRIMESSAISRDGRRMLTENGDETTLWDVRAGKPMRSFAHGGRIGLSADATRALIVSGDGRDLRMVDTDTGKAIFHVNKSREEVEFLDGVSCVSMAPDGSSFVIAGHTGTLEAWDVRTRSKIWDSAEARAGVYSVAAAPSQDRIATGHEFGSSVLWNLRTGNVEHVLEEQNGFGASAPTSLDFAPDGKRAVTGTLFRARIWDTEAGESQKDYFLDSNSYLEHVEFSADGDMLLLNYGVETQIRDVANGRLVRSIAGRLSGGSSLAPNGRYVSTGGEVYSIADGKRLDLIPKFVYARSVAFSPDSRTLASLSFGLASLWDLASGNERRLTDGFSSDDAAQHGVGSVDSDYIQRRTICFSPDGSLVAARQKRYRVAVWDTKSGALVRDFVGHESRINSVVFTGDGRFILSGSNDGTARLWDVATGRQAAILLALNSGKDWIVVTPDGFFDGTAVGRQSVNFRVGERLDVVPVDRFFQDFYYPGLLAAIIQGETPVPNAPFAQQYPPIVDIDSRPETRDERTLNVEVTATDQGGGIKGPWLTHNGARLLGAVVSTDRADNVIRRQFSVRLVEGENVIQAIAASADGSWESEPAGIVVNYDTPLPKPELYVVVVGIGEYAESKLSMRYSDRDASRVIKLFRERGPTLYKHVHITSLIDELATGANILKSIHDVARVAQPQDSVVLYFAGHGAVVDGEYFVLPHEFKLASDSVEDDVRQSALMSSDIGDALALIPALRRMVIFETGHSGQTLSVRRTSRDPFSFRGAIERLGRAQGTFTIAAVSSSDRSTEVDQLEHGILTYSLLAGLKAVDSGPLVDQWIEPASDDNVADSVELFSYSSSHSRQLSKRLLGVDQEIQHSSSGSTFPVLPLPAGTSSPGSTAVVASPSIDSSKPAATARTHPFRTPSAENRSGSTVHVVTIGVSRYRESSMNLRFAADDARAIASLFRERGELVFGDVRITQLLDDGATSEAILSALNKVAGVAGESDTVVVFVAGHGTMIGQRYYFIPHEFSGKTDTLEADVRSLGVPADAIAEAMSKAKCGNRLLILDTCASGGAIKVNRQGQDAFAFRGAIEQIGKQQGVFTLAAAAASDEAQEVEELGHGVLTYCLLAGLRSVESGPLLYRPIQTANQDQVADVWEWISYASGNVPRLTRKYFGREQNVQLSGRGASFPVLPVMDR